MNVSTEDIKNIPAGSLRLFLCEDGAKIKSARSLVSIVKEREDFPDGVVGYETKKFITEAGPIFAIRALREEDQPILKK